MVQSLIKLAKKTVPQPAKNAIRPVLVATSLLLKRPQGYRNFLLNMLAEKMRSPRAFGNPVSITIEPASVCHLRCPACETGAGVLGRKGGLMSYEDFVRILDKVGPGANHLMFYFMGEPFLNKDAYRMIKYARSMGLFVTTCTTGEMIDPEALYESGMSHTSFQIGGITQETHEIYRKRGNLGEQLDVLRRYVEIIRERGRKPGEHEVEMGLIVMKHNEHQIDDFHRLAEELGVDQATVIEPCVRNAEQGALFLTESDDYWLYEREIWEQEQRLVPKRFLPPNSCPWLYYSITIQDNGDVVSCCRDPQGNNIIGNLVEQPLADVWNGEKFQSFRRAVYTDQSKVSLCHGCNGYGMARMW